MQRRPAHQLHIEVALADGPPGRLANGGERLDQEVVEGLALGQAFPEAGRLGGQLVVRQGLHVRLEGVDVRDEGLQGADLPALAGPQDLAEDTHG